MYTYKVEKQKRLLISPLTTARKIAGIYWVIFSWFSYISSPFYFFIFILSLSNWDYESVSTNRQLNLITWCICFSFKKVDRRSAIIHVFTEPPPTQRSRKVVRFMQNEPHLSLYRAQLTKVNLSQTTHVNQYCSCHHQRNFAYISGTTVSTYTRWGRTSCPDTASIVYRGTVKALIWM